MPCLGLHSVDCFLVNKVGESLAGSPPAFPSGWPLGISLSLGLRIRRFLPYPDGT